MLQSEAAEATPRQPLQSSWVAAEFSESPADTDALLAGHTLSAAALRAHNGSLAAPLHTELQPDGSALSISERTEGSCESFNSNEGFGSPVAGRNRRRNSRQVSGKKETFQHSQVAEADVCLVIGKLLARFPGIAGECCSSLSLFGGPAARLVLNLAFVLANDEPDPPNVEGAREMPRLVQGPCSFRNNEAMMVVVMEFCDLQSLHRAITKKVFKPHGKFSKHATYVSPSSHRRHCRSHVSRF